jgi:DNA-binding transcriptional ArsR family regulator
MVAYAINMDEDIVFKALADSTRRLILDELAERAEQTLYELSTRLVMKHNITISRQAIAKHIGVLEAARLLQSERRGKYRIITFNREPIVKITERWVR